VQLDAGRPALSAVPQQVRRLLVGILEDPKAAEHATKILESHDVLDHFGLPRPPA